MAKQKAAPTPGTKPQPRQRSLVWLQGLLCGAMATLATPTALLLGVLLGPALLAILFDHEFRTGTRPQHCAVQHGGINRSVADAMDGRAHHRHRDGVAEQR